MLCQALHDGEFGSDTHHEHGACRGVPCLRTPRLFPWELRANLATAWLSRERKLRVTQHLEDSSARRGFILGKLRPVRVGSLSTATPWS